MDPCDERVLLAIQFEREASGARIAQLEREAEALRKNAERYRWLRLHWFDVGGPLEGSGRSNVAKSGDVETVDAAIDAAIAAQEQKP